MPLILRSVKGSKLSISEMDGNLLYLESLALSGGTSGSTVPAGSNSQIQFNDNGQFGGSSDITYDKNTGVLGTTQIVAQNGVTASFFSNPQIITSDQFIPENHNALMVGPEITIQEGNKVEIGDDSFLTITSYL